MFGEKKGRKYIKKFHCYCQHILTVNNVLFTTQKTAGCVFVLSAYVDGRKIFFCLLLKRNCQYMLTVRRSVNNHCQRRYVAFEKKNAGLESVMNV